MAKGYSVTNIPDETLDLLQDACQRVAKDSGYPVTFQAFLRKTLQDTADREKALQDAAEVEYERQQRESSND